MTHGESAASACERIGRAAGNPNRLKYPWLAGRTRHVVRPNRQRRPAFDDERPIVVHTAQRHVGRQPADCTPGFRPQCLQQLSFDGGDLLVVGIVQRRQRQARGQDAVLAESGRDVRQGPEALRQQAGADKKSDRDGDLRDGQSVPQTIVRCSCDTKALFQRFARADARCSDQRTESEENSGRQRNHRGEQ